MPTGIVVTTFGNSIEWATYKEDIPGLRTITGKRKNITDEAIKAVFQNMQSEYQSSDEAKEKGSFAYKIDGFGEIRFTPDKEV